MMDIRTEIDFDYFELEEALLEGLPQAFVDLQEDYRYETFYTFVLYCPPSQSYISLAANMEEGLERKVREYQARDADFAKIAFDDLKVYFRHLFGDFDFFTAPRDMSAYDKQIEAANKVLRSFADKVEELFGHNVEILDEDEDEAMEYVFPLHERVDDIIERVMQRLDQDRVFEQTNSRNLVTLNVITHDDGPDLAMVRLLNPDSVYEQFAKDHETYLAVRQTILGV